MVMCRGCAVTYFPWTISFAFFKTRTMHIHHPTYTYSRSGQMPTLAAERHSLTTTRRPG